MSLEGVTRRRLSSLRACSLYCKRSTCPLKAIAEGAAVEAEQEEGEAEQFALEGAFPLQSSLPLLVVAIAKEAQA